MRRRRFLTALVIIASSLTLNVYVDYMLILRNPAELEVMVNEALKAIAPDYAPKLGSVVEFSLSQRRVVFADLAFHEKGHPDSPLLHVARVEATLSLVPPALSQITLIEPEVVVRVDEQGNLVPAIQTTEGAAPSLFSDLNVRIRRGRLRVINDYQGLGSEVLISDLNASFDVQTDLSVTGSGMARLGAVFEADDPRARGGTEPAGTPEGKRFKDIFPVVSFDLDGPSDGPLRTEIRLLRGSFLPELRSIIPLEFQESIWKEVNPSGGTVEARLRVLVHERGTQVAVSVRPRGVTVTVAGFPLPITDVGGAFEVSLALAAGKAIPEILNVSWEHVEGSAAGGSLVSRGAVWPSDPTEGTTIYAFIDASDLTLTPALVAAIPENIRKVYELFDPQGVVRSGKVSVVAGPHDEHPQLFVEVAEMDGSISAMYVDYRMRLEDIRGSFSLKPGPSVSVKAVGRLEHGGAATIDAEVMAGDLIRVEVRGHHVPLGDQVLDAMPASVRRRVAPFRPSGGVADFRVVVKKGGEGDIVRPHIEVDVEGVEIRHDDFPYPVTATGRLVLDPVYRAGARASDDSGPERVDLELDLEFTGPGLERGSVVGPLSVGLGEGPAVGDLQVGIVGLELDAQFLDALPSELVGVRQTLGPMGRVAQATVRVQSAELFQARGTGDGLQIVLEQFSYPLAVDTFQVERDGEEVRLNRVRGSTPQGGTFAARGVVVLPREPGGSPLVDIDAQARRVAVDELLMLAVPHVGVRSFLTSMQPKGRISADVHARLTPGIGQQPEIVLDLDGVDLWLNQIVPELEGFADEPLRDVHGRIRIEIPGLVELQGLKGTLAGAEVELAGVIRDPAPIPSACSAAALGGLGGAVLGWARHRLGAPLDLTLHAAGFELNPETLQLLGPQARGILVTFPAEGTVDLSGVVRRGLLDPEPHLLLRFVPRGLRILPTFLQIPLEQVEGTLEIEDGEPRWIDLSGRVGAGRFRIRRDQSQEQRLSTSGQAGMALRIDLDELRRPDDPAEREAFQQHLPRRVQRALDDADPQGPFGMKMALFLPADMSEGDGAIDWVAEFRLGGLAASAGARLEDMQGVVRASGRFSELRRGSAEGEIRLDVLDWKQQTMRNVHGPFRLANGVLRLGERSRPLEGELYDGRMAALIEYRFAEGAYRGWLELRNGRIATCLEELGELRSDTPEPSTSSPRPLTGKIFASMDFQGGGRRLDGRPRAFQAEGALHVRETNLVEVKAFDWLRTVRDALRGETSKPEAFETMHVDYGMTLERVTLRAVRLDSPSLILVGGEDLIQGGEGWIRLSDDPATNGDIFLDLSPFDTGSTMLDNLLQMSVPLTGVTVRNKVYDPQVIVGVPFYGAAEKIWRGFLSDEDDEDEDQGSDGEERED